MPLFFCFLLDCASKRRTVVIVRDPRNVIMSERKMRIEYYKEDWVKGLAMDEFVRQRFEVGLYDGWSSGSSTKYVLYCGRDRTPSILECFHILDKSLIPTSRSRSFKADISLICMICILCMTWLMLPGGSRISCMTSDMFPGSGLYCTYRPCTTCGHNGE